MEILSKFKLSVKQARMNPNNNNTNYRRPIKETDLFNINVKNYEKDKINQTGKFYKKPSDFLVPYDTAIRTWRNEIKTTYLDYLTDWYNGTAMKTETWCHNFQPEDEILYKTLYAAHYKPFVIALLGNLIDLIKKYYISIEQFTQTLKECITTLQRQLQNKPYILVLDVKATGDIEDADKLDNYIPKSSCWVGSKVIDVLGKPAGYIVIDHSNGGNIIKTDIFNDDKKIIDVSDYVVVDDASYSGKQLCEETIPIVLSVFGQSTEKKNLHVLVPYCGINLYSYVYYGVPIDEAYKERIKLNLIMQEKMDDAYQIVPSFLSGVHSMVLNKRVELLDLQQKKSTFFRKPKPEYEAIIELIEYVHRRIISMLADSHKKLYVFEHKVPDNVSVPNLLLEFCDFHDELKPIYPDKSNNGKSDLNSLFTTPYEVYVLHQRQHGGNNGHAKIRIKKTGRVYILRCNKPGGKAYILQQKEKVYLSSIKGKYTYVRS